ncbi:4'-phosphopantetheinyl transferase family protein [Bacillus solimangrovi]|nr:4'-phosphopantetheinyl transferase superfamily protein [Bacillus solimangrovi]
MNISNKLNQSQISWFINYLDQSELQRYCQYLNEDKAKEFLLGRVLLKWALSNDIGIPINELTLYPDDYGKLYLKNHPLSFNLTHSGNMIACILSEGREVGIDVEFVPYDSLEVMDLMFTEGERRFVESKTDIEKVQEAFYFVWTRKEAYIKAIGKGFSIDPKTINVPLHKMVEKKRGFTYYSFYPSQDYLISIVVEGNLDTEALSLQELSLEELYNSDK